MPTTTYKRMWCKKCQEWELFLVPHLRKEEEPLKCKECETPFEPYMLSEVPDEKITEQRKRYTDNKRDGYLSFLTSLQSNRSYLADMFKEPGYEREIHESDAGQKAIDEKIAKEREEKRLAAKAKYDELVAEYQKYKGLGRNDTCACGSGLKYKKCCINKFQWMK